MEQNLSLYRIFYTVANAGNISKAARELYISQPAISKAISKLESGLNTSLFVRNSRGVALTDEGKIMYEQVRCAFDAINHGEQELSKIKELGIGHIHLGVSTTLCKYILLPYLESYISLHPHLKFTIENQASAQTINMLEQQRLDLGLIAKPSFQKNIQFYPVTEIEDIFVCSPSYRENFHVREAGKDILTAGTVMLLNQNNMTRHHIDAYLNEHQIQLSNILEVSTMDLLIEFARIGLGVGCCIKECVQKELDDGSLMQIALESPIPKRAIGFATSLSSLNSHSVQDFLNFVSQN